MLWRINHSPPSVSPPRTRINPSRWVAAEWLGTVASKVLQADSACDNFPSFSSAVIRVNWIAASAASEEECTAAL